MKTILAVSDTHGKKAGMEEIARLLTENDFIVHLGDGEGALRELARSFPDKVYRVAGNCDIASASPYEGVLEVEGVRIFYCHGHTYGVKNHLYRLAEAAKERDCSIALYGHTHRARIDEVDGVTLINPGTLQYPLNAGGSYGYLVVRGNKVTPTIVGTPFA